MRKLSLLTIAIVACFLSIATTASADDRYAEPTGDGDPTQCLPSDRCSLEGALDPANLDPGDRVFLKTGEYTTTTALTLDDDNFLKGEGQVGDTVINSNGLYNVPALTLAGGSEASRFSIVASGEFSKGLSVVDGIVDHLSVTANGSDACTGVEAIIINSLCRATGATVFGAGFQRAAASGYHSITLTNSTFIASPFWYGASIEAHGTAEVHISILSSILYGSNQGIHLIKSGTSSELDFFAEHSNFGQLKWKIDSVEQTPEDPTGTNQPLESAPLFTNDESDFTQAPGSPTINAGAANGRTGSTDILGNPREQGGVVDIGAYESDYIPPVVEPPATGGGTTPPPVVIPDTTKPTITVSKKPKSSTTSKKLSVTFKASETSTFLCKLDKGKFKTCKSPYKKTVKLGKHKLQIKATDAAGNVSSVKTISWKVK